MTKKESVITKDTVLQIRLTSREKAEIRALADKKGYSMSDLIKVAIMRLIAEDEFLNKYL